jgi:hypothetical protein
MEIYKLSIPYINDISKSLDIYKNAIPHWLNLGGLQQSNNIQKLWGTPEIAAEFILTYHDPHAKIKLTNITNNNKYHKYQISITLNNTTNENNIIKHFQNHWIECNGIITYNKNYKKIYIADERTIQQFYLTINNKNNTKIIIKQL